jgi:uncharacterized membrane protein YbhN (UPF0104 family)
MSGKTKRLPYFDLLKILIGVGLLGISLQGVNWSLLIDSLAKINLVWLSLVISLMLGSLLLKIYRSYILLKNFEVEITFGRTMEAFLLGQAINFILPSRGGDLIRMGYLSAKQASQLPQVTGAVIIEKFLDLITMTVVALTVSAYLPSEDAFWVRSWLLPLSALATGVLVLLVLFGPQAWANLRDRISRWPKPWVQKICRWVDQLVNSSLWLRTPQRLIVSMGLTIVIWAVMAATNQALFRGFSLQVPLVAAGLVLILGYIGVLPNLMPGNVGPFYFFVQLGMAPFGIAQEVGLAYTVLLHAFVTMTPLIASGVTMLVSESVRQTVLRLWKTR